MALCRLGSLELDLPAFNTCLENDDYMDLIENDLDFVLTAGVLGTLTFFINGLELVDAQFIEVFTEVIDAELKALNGLRKSGGVPRHNLRQTSEIYSTKPVG